MHTLAAILTLFAFTAMQVTPASAKSEAATSAEMEALVLGAGEPEDDVLSVKPTADGRFISIGGRLESGSYRKIRRVLADNPAIRSLWLDSDGGLALEGFLIASLVREKKLDTYVEANCASACTLILASGVRRQAYARAQIGFHNTAEVDEHGVPVKKARRARDGRLLAEEAPDLFQYAVFHRAGVDKAFVDRALSTANVDIWEPSHAEMLAAGMLTESVSEEARARLGGDGISHALVRQMVLDDPVAVRFAKALPDEADAIITAAWREGQSWSGGPVNLAMTRMADMLMERMLDAPDQLVPRFLLLVAAHDPAALITAKPWAFDGSLIAPASAAEAAGPAPCRVPPSGALALMALLQNGESAEERSLIDALLALPEPQALWNTHALDKAYTGFFKRVEKGLPPAPDDDPEQTVWQCRRDAEAARQLAALPLAEAVRLLRAIHHVEAR